MSLTDTKRVQVEGERDSNREECSLLANGKVSFQAMPKKKESTVSEPPSNNIPPGSLNGVPKLEPAVSLVERELFDRQSPSASLNIIHVSRHQLQIKPTSTVSLANQAPVVPAQNNAAMDTIKQNTCSYKSKELREDLRVKKLLQNGKNGHTWQDTISVKIGQKKVSVHIFLFPNVSDSNDTKKAKLDVMVEMGQRLLQMLRKYDECQIKVETEVCDMEAGQNLGCTQFSFHTISMEDGKVNFRQDLADCERVKVCQGNSVTLAVKVTIDLLQNVRQLEEEDSFVENTPQQQPPAQSEENTQLQSSPDSVALSVPRENPLDLATSAHEDIHETSSTLQRKPLNNFASRKKQGKLFDPAPHLLDSAVSAQTNLLEENGSRGKPLDPAASAQGNLLDCPEENRSRGKSLDPAAENVLHENVAEFENTQRKKPTDCAALPEEMVVDNCNFESKEVYKKLKIAKFLEGGRQGHTWRHTVSVKIKGKEVSVTLLLFPSDNTGGQEKAMLGVAAEMEQKLHRVLSEVKSQCEIKVETKVLDSYVGKSLGSTEFEFHPINMENGKVNYRQELADCSKMKLLNRNNSVDLVVKIKTNTKTIYPYLNFELGGKGNNDVNP